MVIKEASRVDDFYALSAFEGWVGSTVCVWIVNPETTEPILIWAQKKIDGYKMFFVKFLYEFSRTFLIFRCTILVPTRKIQPPYHGSEDPSCECDRLPF